MDIQICRVLGWSGFIWEIHKLGCGKKRGGNKRKKEEKFNKWKWVLFNTLSNNRGLVPTLFVNVLSLTLQRFFLAFWEVCLLWWPAAPYLLAAPRAKTIQPGKNSSGTILASLMNFGGKFLLILHTLSCMEWVNLWVNFTPVQVVSTKS